MKLLTADDARLASFNARGTVVIDTFLIECQKEIKKATELKKYSCLVIDNSQNLVDYGLMNKKPNSGLKALTELGKIAVQRLMDSGFTVEIGWWSIIQNPSFTISWEKK